MLPNRPDALGIFEDSKIAKSVGAFQQTRYADAVNRLVERLLFRQETASGGGARGKRRSSNDPKRRSNTLKLYLYALERWSYYSVAVWGKEIDAREVDTDIAAQYARWLSGEAPGPDIRGMLVRALGPDFIALYEAVDRAGGLYGQVDLPQIVEAMEPAARDRFVFISSDPNVAPDLSQVHTMMGKLIRNFRNIRRAPTAAQVRAEEGKIWSEREKNPLTYTYTIIKQESLGIGGVVAHLGALSAIWSEMTVRTSQDQAPLAFNPWKSVYARWALRNRTQRANAKARGELPILTTAIVRSMFNAARGLKLEHRRDTLALTLLAVYGLRSEELAGLMRKDVITVDGVLNLAVLGKGNKVRQLPLYSDVRDAITLLEAKLEEEASKTFITEDGELEQAYEAQYAAALLGPEAPLIPSLARWGCNQRDRDAAEDAMEPLDTSGVTAMLDRIATAARVKEIDSGICRPLSKCEPDCREKGPCRHEMRRVHPHAFRHYAATAAQQSGVPLSDVQEVLGHTDIRTTQGYIQVSPQKSMAFSAGVFRMLNRQPALTSDEVEALRTKSMNPLEDKFIVEADPSDDRPGSAARAPQRAPEAQRTVAAPMWAYSGGEETEQYLPPVGGRPATYKSFAADYKRLEGIYLQAAREAKAAGDEQATANATSLYLQASARKLWNTFRIGKETRLPWWAGHANRWPPDRMAPILSYAQIAPEDSDQSQVIEQLKALYNHLWSTQGPSAAAALVTWLTEVVEVASTQFAQDMLERDNTWILFDEPAPSGDESIVREHAIEPILGWFEAYGWALRQTVSKSSKNRGNIALASMEDLPEWFWYPDPILALPGEERKALQDWVTNLQGRRKSRIRFEQWVDQYAARIGRWGQDRRQFERASGRQWEAGARSGTAAQLGKRLDAITADFASMFPTVRKTPDVGKLAKESENDIRSALRSMLASEGIDPANPSRAEIKPAIKTRAGRQHPFDPALLTFDLRSTIVHDEPTKKYWFERYGSDSECVVRRAVRSLWEQRKAALKVMGRQRATRIFDAELSAIIPCPAEMERRMVEKGWKPPKSIDDLVDACRVMWDGLTDRMRMELGGKPLTKVPQQPVADFWAPEMEEIEGWIVSFTRTTPSVMEGPAGALTVQRMADEQTVEGPSVSPDIPRFAYSDCEPPPMDPDLKLYRRLQANYLLLESDDRPAKRLLEWAAESLPKEAGAQLDTPAFVEKLIQPTDPRLENFAIELAQQEQEALIELLNRVRPTSGIVIVQDDQQWLEEMKARSRQWQSDMLSWLGSADVDPRLKQEPVARALAHGNGYLFEAGRRAVCGDLTGALAELEEFDTVKRLYAGFLGSQPDSDARHRDAGRIAINLRKHIESIPDLAPPAIPNPSPGAGKRSAERRSADAMQAASELSTRTRPDASGIATLDANLFRRVLGSGTDVLAIGSDRAASCYSMEHLRSVLSEFSRFGPSVYWDWRTLRIGFVWTPKGQNRRGVWVVPIDPQRLARMLSATAITVDLTDAGAPTDSPVWYDDRSWEPRWPGYPLPDPSDDDSSILRDLPWPDPDSPSIIAASLWGGCMQAYSRWKRNGQRPGQLPNGWKDGTDVSGIIREEGELATVPVAHPVDLVFAALRSA
jgi:integrase